MPTTAKPLTDAQIRTAKPRDKQYKLADGGGMFLLIKPNASKLWQMNYRLNGKSPTASFGPYPEISLVEARERRAIARKQIDNGIHPTEHKKAVKQAVLAVTANTFESVAWEWFENKIRPPNHCVSKILTVDALTIIVINVSY